MATAAGSHIRRGLDRLTPVASGFYNGSFAIFPVPAAAGGFAHENGDDC